MIEAGDDEFYKAAEFIQGGDEMDTSERAVRLEWLESAVRHARKVADPARRVRVLASVAERLFDLEEVALARQILAEAENVAKPLFLDYGAQYASLHISLAAVHDDAGRAIDWLAKTGIYLKWHGGRVAARLLPDRRQQAVEVWRQVVEAMRTDQSRTFNGSEYRAAAEFCYRLALVDRSLAEQVAADADEAILRFREKGAILLALAETQPAEARRLLAILVREELPHVPIEKNWLLPQESAPAIAAWLLPVAERVDPDLCGELFWRSLALRLPRPRRNGFNNHAERSDIQLARLLGRYDRGIARALLEPISAKESERFVAAIYVDPHWAKALLDTVDDLPSSVEHGDHLRFYLVQALAVPLPDRWTWDGDSAGFWEPSARERPLPP